MALRVSNLWASQSTSFPFNIADISSSGLAVFGGFTLYDVQKILHHARQAEMGLRKADPVNESVSLELDFINLFVRFVQILGMQKRK